MQWTDRIGRRVKLRDLHILLAVAQSGSLSRAAERLAISYPVVSRTISDLEHALGVRLFDRGAMGVEPTMYGRTFLECGTAVFDELRQGVQRIEFLSDPTVGELRIGSSQPLMAGLLAMVIDRLVVRYPRIAIQSTTAGSSKIQRTALRERTIDVAIIPVEQSSEDRDLDSEWLFDEQLFVVAGLHSRWGRRRKIELAELMDDHWILPYANTAAGTLIESRFRANGLAPPRHVVVSDSIHLRNTLLATGRYLSVLPESMLRFGPKPLTVKKLPIPLLASLPYEIVTLKNRTLSPAVQLFIECAREVAKPLAKREAAGKLVAAIAAPKK